MKLRRLVILWVVSTFCLAVNQVEAQQIRTEFGKNRVQYHDDFTKWWMYETENFIVYWYGKGRNIAQTAIQIAEYVHPDIQNLVEHRINDKIEIIVYTDISDLLQSNIGNEETFETRHASTKVIGSRIFLYFDGNHQNMERRIKEGIAQVFLNAMYVKGSLQEIIDSDPELAVPTWYKEGFASFAGASWDPLMEDELRDLWYLKKNKYKDFNRLSADHPRVAGHSMWYFLTHQYGKSSITTLLYLMRLRHDLEENVEFIFGFNLKKLKKNWSAFYRDLYNREYAVFDSLDVQNAKSLGFKKYWPKTYLRLSPDGMQLIYIVNQQGKYQVVLEQMSDNARQVIFRFGSKNAVQQPDYNYPRIAWHPQRDEVTICYERRDLIVLRRLDLSTGQYAEQEIPENIQRVFDIDYISDDEYMFNALIDGYSDLYIYGAKYREAKPITEDFYDDIDASYVQMGEQWGVLFASNRPTATILPQDIDTILPTANYDIFFLPLNSEYALRLTNTPDISERHPRLVNDHYLAFLSDQSGVYNRYVLNLNSRRPAYANSNLPRNIINHDAVRNSDRYVWQVYQDGAYYLYDQSPEWNRHAKPYLTSTANMLVPQEQIPIAVEDVQDYIDPDLLFQSKFEDPDILEDLEDNAIVGIIKRSISSSFQIADANRSVVPFYPARAVAARRQFKLEDFSTTVNNDVLFDGLESYTDDRAEIQAQQTGILVKGTVKDIFEDFRIDLGVRIPTNFRGSEFFAVLDDRRARIDKRYALYRKQVSESGFSDPFSGTPALKQTEITWIALHRLSYPFDTYRSVRLTGQLRSDQQYVLLSEPILESAESFDEKRISLKAEYIYDNTLDIDLNLRHGTRYKFYTEFINRFDLQIGDQWSLDASRGITSILGFDARHYQPLLRNSIIALRGTGATSFGSDKMLYYVGGTDGWVTPRYNQDIPVPSGQSFAFKTIAPNLRGFDHNIRNGRSFLLGSAELRIPFFKYLSRKEIKSSFFRNIQATAFFDVGSAWHGLWPSIEGNPLNTVTLQQKGVEVTLNLARSTFVYGYGVGARINLLGYFIRADYAWGVESGLRQDPKLYISLGTDF